MIDKMNEILAAVVPAIFQMMIGFAVMGWLLGDEDRKKKNRKK